MAKQKYQNIPVKPETYAKVRLVATANNRGLGDQVTEWAERELPDCDHEKEPVLIEWFGGDTQLHGTKQFRTGWYCTTCKRVYALSQGGEPADEKRELVRRVLLNDGGTAVEGAAVALQEYMIEKDSPMSMTWCRRFVQGVVDEMNEAVTA